MPLGATGGTAGVMIGQAPLAVLVLMAVLAISTVTDLRERRVPLWLTASGILGGLLLAAGSGGMGGAALQQSGIGLVVGLLLLSPFVMLGGIGLGDALLLGVVGTWFGWTFVLWTAWWASVAGAALALVVVAAARIRKQRAHSIPYVPAITMGALVVLVTAATRG